MRLGLQKRTRKFISKILFLIKTWTTKTISKVKK